MTKKNKQLIKAILNFFRAKTLLTKLHATESESWYWLLGPREEVRAALAKVRKRR